MQCEKKDDWLQGQQSEWQQQVLLSQILEVKTLFLKIVIKGEVWRVHSLWKRRYFLGLSSLSLVP